MGKHVFSVSQKRISPDFDSIQPMSHENAMNDFPVVSKNPKTRISPESQDTEDVEGYVVNRTNGK